MDRGHKGGSRQERAQVRVLHGVGDRAESFMGEGVSRVGAERAAGPPWGHSWSHHAAAGQATGAQQSRPASSVPRLEAGVAWYKYS